MMREFRTARAAQLQSPQVYEPGGGDPALSSHGALPPLGSFLSGGDYHARRQVEDRATCIDVNHFFKLALRLAGAKLFLPSATLVLQIDSNR